MEPWLLCVDHALGGSLWSVAVGRAIEGVTVKYRTVLTCAVGTSASLGLMVVASAAPAAVNVPCTNQAALMAAVNAANAAGGGTINLASGCRDFLVSADNPGNGLPW